MNGRFLVPASALSLFLVTAVDAGQAKPAAPAANPSAAAKASPESIANGETIFKRQCQICHGATGLGDGPASKMLNGKLPNMTDKDAMAKIRDEEIHEAIAKGRKTAVGSMPAFDNMKPEEIQDAINYVRSLAK
jgi:mono/diheme cytochrome c family protein